MLIEADLSRLCEDTVRPDHIGRVLIREYKQLAEIVQKCQQHEIIVENTIAAHGLDDLKAVCQLADTTQQVVGGIQAFTQHAQQVHGSD